MLNFLFYFALLVFVLMVLYRFSKYQTMPMHLRWEIYPVPHDPRHEHGGSYYEEPEWWKKPIKKTLIGEIKEMLAEMLFIKRVFKYKRSLWLLTYPFHIGIYLILLWFALLIINALAEIFNAPDFIYPILDSLILIVGVAAMALMFIFGIALIVRRVSDWELRNYSGPLDYLNLLFILAVVFTGILAWQEDPDFSLAKEYAISLITLAKPPEVSDVTSLHIALLSLLLIYLPFTKMMHWLAKWFTYHKILWEDEPNLKGSEIEEKAKKYLQAKVKWSAHHIDPNLSWADEAMRCDLAGVCDVREVLKR